MVIGAISFWEAFLLMFLLVPVTIVWAWSIFDNLARDDHSRWAKAGWFVILVPLPLLGTLIYVITRSEADLRIATERVEPIS